MLYLHPSAVRPGGGGGVLLINRIDCPGHVEFASKKVARSLSFVRGTVLLLDALQEIQGQI
jgi:translation elongation factor EF-4